MECSTLAWTRLDIARLAREAGHRAIDAPISGGMVGANERTLTFMIGGDADEVDAVRPLIDAMGDHTIHCGGHGAGLVAKICNNMLLAINQIGVAEAFALGERLGMDAQKLWEVISISSGQSWSVTTNSPVPGWPAMDPAVGLHWVRTPTSGA